MFTVAQHYRIMEQLGLKYSSRKLVAICIIIYLLAHIEYFRVGTKHGLYLPRIQ